MLDNLPPTADRRFVKISSLSKIRKSPLGIVVLGLTMAVLAGTALAQELIGNGDFEMWESTSGEPPEGIPLNWSIASSTAPPVQGPGVAKGASYSAVILPGPGNQIVQGVRGRPVAALVEVVFAATEPGADGRSFSMNLGQVGIEAPHVNFRIVRGSAPAKLTLEAFDGQNWETIAADIFDASDYDQETNTFRSLKPQLLRVSLDLAAGQYSVSCGPDASKLKHFPKLKIFQTEGTGEGLSSITFSAANSQAPYAVGRVSVSAL